MLFGRIYRKMMNCEARMKKNDHNQLKMTRTNECQQYHLELNLDCFEDSNWYKFWIEGN